jgi:hypothetical protein
MASIAVLWAIRNSQLDNRRVVSNAVAGLVGVGGSDSGRYVDVPLLMLPLLFLNLTR